MQRYHIPKSRVLGHGMLKPTDCPGKQFPWDDFYRRLG
jgi:N-acetyl-anhydromuramyl-L-alanine amidase AmpD